MDNDKGLYIVYEQGRYVVKNEFGFMESFRTLDEARLYIYNFGRYEL